MSVVLGLGKYLSVQTMTEWLSRSCLFSFDKALCNKNLRVAYLEWTNEFSGRFLGIQIVRHIPFHYIDKVVAWSLTRFTDASKVFEVVDIDETSLLNFSVNEQLFEECASYASLIDGIEFHIHNHDPIQLESQSILQLCCHVRKLTLRRAYNLYSHVAKWYHNLTAIDFYGCYDKMQEFAFVNILRNNKRLTSVNVGLCLISSATINALIVHCRNIETLNIQHCLDLLKRDHLKLSLHCRWIMKALHCDTFDPFEMKCFLQYQNVSSLQWLDLSKTPKPYLDASCPYITSINLRECSLIEAGTVNAISNLKMLQVCNLEFILMLDSIVVMEIASHCRSLHTLLLYKTESSFNCLNLVDLGKVCPTLTTLSLMNMQSLSPIALVAILMNGEHFQHLCLDNNMQLSDMVFNEGSKYLKSLRVLSVTNCRRFTNSVLSCLKVHCKQLQQLDCRKCILMTMAEVSSFESSSMAIVSSDFKAQFKM